MKLWTAVGICVAFVTLMCIVIVNETISVVDVLSTLVSSVTTVALSRPHEYSILALSGKYQNRSVFNLSDICTCEVETSDYSSDCSVFTVHKPALVGVVGSTDMILMLTVGPMDWQKRESVVFECRHSFVPLITFYAFPLHFETVVNEIIGGESVASVLDETVLSSPSPWINSNTINQVLLSREEHYKTGKLENTYIKTSVLQGSHEYDDLTQVMFAMREGQVVMVDKLYKGTFWALVTLMCTVLLSVERSVAFINRAKNNRQQKLMQINNNNNTNLTATEIRVSEAGDDADIRATPSPSAPDPNFGNKDDGVNSRVFWSARSG
ncbi:uncharacterized protein LOC134840340 [Symsagittifera roscoffensis]|uniref:uncharacterized protein LOC134840340 n=1 Tax=Symsagittifera roscoffensis TaxID=84072 RepID=UPI00307BEE4B